MFSVSQTVGTYALRSWVDPLSIPAAQLAFWTLQTRISCLDAWFWTATLDSPLCCTLESLSLSVDLLCLPDGRYLHSAVLDRFLVDSCRSTSVLDASEPKFHSVLSVGCCCTWQLPLSLCSRMSGLPWPLRQFKCA